MVILRKWIDFSGWCDLVLHHYAIYETKAETMASYSDTGEVIVGRTMSRRHISDILPLMEQVIRIIARGSFAACVYELVHGIRQQRQQPMLHQHHPTAEQYQATTSTLMITAFIC